MSAPQLALATSRDVATAADGPADRRVRRKRLGQWYTPESLVDHLVGVVVRTAARPPRHVLDPACGDGRFLAAARDAFGPGVRLLGVDVDPAAVRAARERVPSAEIRLADALTTEFGDERFDLVIGNPPFLNQLAAATSRGGRSRFGGGPYADAAAEFLALAVSLATPSGGQVALVLPQSILTARDAGPIRATASERASLTHAWWSTTAMFDANVHVCALVLTAAGRVGPVTRACGPAFSPRPPVTVDGSWGRLLLDAPGDTQAGHAASGLTLGDVATFSADFRDQYYGLVDAVDDAAEGPPLVTSGLIDPGVCLWGERPVRFAKRTFAAPRVDVGLLSPRLQRWAAQRLVPKVLVANQTRRIEAVIDRDGEWLPSVPVISCVPHRPTDLDAVWAALSSPATTAWVLERAAGSGLAPGTVRLNPSLLAGAAWPNDVTRTGDG